MKKQNLDALSENSQIGLYGELYFLRNFLKSFHNQYKCIFSWKGPEKSIQDFQFEDMAIEVKTTHGKNHQKIHIANEKTIRYRYN